MSSTTYYDQLILDKTLRNDDFVFSTLYLGLFRSNPGKAGTLTSEVSAAEYERQAISFGTDHKNESEINFPVALASWGSIQYVGLCTNLTGPYLTIYGYEFIAVASYQLIRFAAGAITISVT